MAAVAGGKSICDAHRSYDETTEKNASEKIRTGQFTSSFLFFEACCRLAQYEAVQRSTAFDSKSQEHRTSGTVSNGCKVCACVHLCGSCVQRGFVLRRQTRAIPSRCPSGLRDDRSFEKSPSNQSIIDPLISGPKETSLKNVRLRRPIGVAFRLADRILLKVTSFFLIPPSRTPPRFPSPRDVVATHISRFPSGTVSGCRRTIRPVGRSIGQSSWHMEYWQRRRPHRSCESSTTPPKKKALDVLTHDIVFLLPFHSDDQGFWNPRSQQFTVPRSAGRSFSFTKDGFWEEAIFQWSNDRTSCRSFPFAIDPTYSHPLVPFDACSDTPRVRLSNAPVAARKLLSQSSQRHSAHGPILG